MKRSEFPTGGSYSSPIREGSFELHGDRVIRLGLNMYDDCLPLHCVHFKREMNEKINLSLFCDLKVQCEPPRGDTHVQSCFCQGIKQSFSFLSTLQLQYSHKQQITCIIQESSTANYYLLHTGPLMRIFYLHSIPQVSMERRGLIIGCMKDLRPHFFCCTTKILRC